MSTLFHKFVNNAPAWARIVLFTGSALYSVWLLSIVIRWTYLETNQLGLTSIRLDLLQAFSFLVAWSFLLITITSKVVNEGNDMNYRIARTQELSEQNRELYGEVLEKSQVALSKARTALQETELENEQLRAEINKLQGE